ncbi:MAG: hypothetical protein ABL926_14125 [Novosphingobium sp.]
MDIAKTILGVATFLLIWGALPIWFWWFTTRISDFMPEFTKRRTQRYMLVGVVWLGLTIWMIWRFVLPDWWIEATPMPASEG